MEAERRTRLIRHAIIAGTPSLMASVSLALSLLGPRIAQATPGFTQGTLIILGGSAEATTPSPITPPQLFPQPKSVTWLGPQLALASAGVYRVCIRLDPALGSRVAQGALYVAEQIVELAGIPADPATLVVTDSVPPGVQVVIHAGAAGLADPAISTVPPQAEGYVIQSLQRGVTNEVLVAGRDADGVYWGLMTLRQSLAGDYGQAVLLTAHIRDWPDQRWRSMPLNNPTDAYLDFVTRHGRLNLAAYEPLAYGGVLRSFAAMSNAIACMHAHGMKVVANGGYWHDYIQTLKGRGFCPLQDTTNMLAIYTLALDAGADGLDWHFDDLNSYGTAEVLHYRQCPLCSAQFDSLAASQVYCLQALRTLGLSRGKTTFWACPTIYSLSFTNSYRTTYGIDFEDYIDTLCHFDGSDDYRFYFCEFRTAEMQALRDKGLRNYIWWNNGLWSAACPEIWDAYLAFPKMFYSWDLYDRNAIINAQTEIFHTNRYTQLATLKNETDLVYTGGGDPIAIAMGTLYGWNNAAFIGDGGADEAATRRHLVGCLYGTHAIPYEAQWESLAKPLWVRYLRGQPASAQDRADLQTLDDLARVFEAVDTEVTADINGPLRTVVQTLRTYQDLLQALDNGQSYPTAYYYGHGADDLLAIGPAVARPASFTDVAPASLTGPTPAQVVAAGHAGVFLVSNQLTTAASTAFTLNQSAFSVEVYFTPMRHTFTKLLGSRSTFRELYPNLPGWAVGMQPDISAARLTVEDTSGHISTITAPVPILATTHLLFVRDWPNRQLRVYLNGALHASVAETGTGTLGSGAKSLIAGFDHWGGGYLNAAVHRLRLLAGARSNAQAAALYAACREPRLILAGATATDRTDGNGDGVVDPGENIVESVRWINAGLATATNVTATLHTTTPDVAVLSGAVAYPDVPSGASSSNAAPLLYHVGKTVVPGTLMGFTAVARSDSLAFTGSFTRAVGQAVHPVNVPPVASNAVALAWPSRANALKLRGSDIDGDTLTFATLDPPSHGSLSGLNPATGDITYTPTSGYVGGDSFTFRVSDGATNSAPATIDLMVVPSRLNITLAQPLRSGDLWFTGRDNAGRYRVCCIRPAVPAANAITLFDSGWLGTTNEYWAFAFNRRTGDFFYTSGYDTTDHYGHVLRRVAAGGTHSTLVLADMATTATCCIRGLAIAGDNTLYAAQDYDTANANHGIIRRFLPDDVGGWQPGTNWRQTTHQRTGAAEFGLTRDDRFILLCGGHNVLNWMQVYATADGALVTEQLSEASGTAHTWVPHPPSWTAIDYAHGLDAHGRLRLLHCGGAFSSSDGSTSRIGVLAFDPASGALANPYSGIGNIPGNTNAFGVAKRSDGNGLAGGIAFDPAGNLLVAPGGSQTQIRRFTQAQIDAHDPNLNLADATPVCTYPAAFSEVTKLTVADLPSGLDIVLHAGPIQSGDVWLVGRGSDSQYRVFSFRPAVPASQAITLYQSPPLGTSDPYISFAFNRHTGDFYYSSGYDTAVHYGHVLRRIAAGATHSTVVVADMATTPSCAIRGLACASNGTVYAAQDMDVRDVYDGTIRRFLSDGNGGLQAGTNWMQTTHERIGAAEFSLTQDDKFILLCGGHNALNWMQAYRTSDGALMQDLPGDAVCGTGHAWVPRPPTWAAIDYAHPPDAQGRLRLFQLGGSFSAADAAVNRIAELAFDPVSGQIANPYAGVGNVPGNSNALAVARRDSAFSSAIVFDAAGNLLCAPGSGTAQARRFAPSQLDAQNPNTDLDGATPVWNYPLPLTQTLKCVVAP